MTLPEYINALPISFKFCKELNTGKKAPNTIKRPAKPKHPKIQTIDHGQL